MLFCCRTGVGFLAFPLKRDSPPQETLDPSAKPGQFSVVHSMENLGPMRRVCACVKR